MMDEAKTGRNEAFRQRTQAAALRIIRLYQQLPCTGEAEVLGKQLLRWLPITGRRAGRAPAPSTMPSYVSAWRKLTKHNFGSTLLAKLALCPKYG